MRGNRGRSREFPNKVMPGSWVPQWYPMHRGVGRSSVVITLRRRQIGSEEMLNVCLGGPKIAATLILMAIPAICSLPPLGESVGLATKSKAAMAERIPRRNTLPVWCERGGGYGVWLLTTILEWSTLDDLTEHIAVRPSSSMSNLESHVGAQVRDFFKPQQTTHGGSHHIDDARLPAIVGINFRINADRPPPEAIRHFLMPHLTARLASNCEPLRDISESRLRSVAQNGCATHEFRGDQPVLECLYDDSSSPTKLATIIHGEPVAAGCDRNHKCRHLLRSRRAGKQRSRRTTLRT